jgi:hypothetical protein
LCLLCTDSQKTEQCCQATLILIYGFGHNSFLLRLARPAWIGKACLQTSSPPTRHAEIATTFTLTNRQFQKAARVAWSAGICLAMDKRLTFAANSKTQTIS